MYYNFTEDQKAFYETSYSLLKAGYTNEEIVEFWSNDNEEEVEFILESLEYVDINRKDPDFVELNEGLGGLVTAASIAIKTARTARKLNRLRKIAQLAKPNISQRREIAKLTKELGDKAKGIKINYKQTPKDELAKVVRQTSGTDDVLKSVRPGESGTLRGSASQRPGEFPSVNQTTTAAAPKSTPAPPKSTPVVTPKPGLSKTKVALGVAGGGAAIVAGAGSDNVIDKVSKTFKTDEPKSSTAASIQSNIDDQEAERIRKRESERSATQQQIDKDNQRYGNTFPQGSFNVSPKGSSRRSEVENDVKSAISQRQRKIKNDNAQREMAAKEQSRKDALNKAVGEFSRYRTPGLSRRGVTGGVNNSYEYAIDKLISEGHASSIEEAEYVFKQLDDDFIKAIIS